MTLTWKRLSPDIWLSRDRNWLIRKTPSGNVCLDNLVADEVDVFVGQSLEAAQSAAERLATEEYNAILAGDATEEPDTSLDSGESLDAAMPDH